MIKHLQYAKYIIRHKWYVLIECWKMGFLWLGIIHDWSKLLPSEWFPYTNFFYGQPCDETGYYKPTDTGNIAFDYAWLLHQKRNKHHWQWWILPEDEGGTKVFPMPRKYREEMLADWRGANRACNGDGVGLWYTKNKNKMTLHSETREWVEVMLCYHDGYLPSPVAQGE